jgi:glycosyltransferase involved in cell wall biosynthesis
MNINNQKLVSICMITYNHEKYIAEAIDKILMQKLNADYEIVISEDCSTDKTRVIALDYKNRYPDKVKLLLRANNIGMIQNFADTLKACSGKYIAVCEGDDYWTDPYKLQKQVDFLEAHPDYSMTAHRVAIFDEELKVIKRFSPKNKSTLMPKEIILGAFIPTLSIVFRTVYIKNIPDLFYKTPIPDLSLKIHLSSKGDIYFFNDVMGVYRSHPDGITKKNIIEWKYKELNSNALLKEYYPQYSYLLEKQAMTLKAKIIGYKNVNGLKKEEKDLNNDYSFFKSLLFYYKIIRSTIYFFLTANKLYKYFLTFKHRLKLTF